MHRNLSIAHTSPIQQSAKKTFKDKISIVSVANGSSLKEFHIFGEIYDSQYNHETAGIKFSFELQNKLL